MPTPLRRSAALGTSLVLSLGALAPSALLVETAAAASPVVSPSRTPSAQDRLEDRLPARWQARLDAAARRTGMEFPASDAVARAIDPDDHECGPTAFDAYIDGLLTGLSDEEFFFLLLSGVLVFPTYDALFFGDEDDRRYDLRRDARDITRTFRDARRFWDVPSADIELMAMNGDVLTDRARLVRLLTVVFGFPRADAVEYAAFVVEYVDSVPEFRGGDNPLFTLNAFAFTAEGEDGFFGSLPDKIVMGEGVIDALHAMGIGDVGPESVLAHEFAHHVQFEQDLFDSPLEGAEATRRTELMADAMGTYHLTHKRGLALNARRVLEAEQTFYAVGDCGFADPGHHGTPLQRLRASAWGADLAADQQKQGHVLPSLVVASRFDRALPRLVAPDAD